VPHEAPEVGGEFVGEAEPRRGRLVAVATVLTTLAAAATGYMQATALRDHAEAAVRAERLGALAVNVSAGSKDQAQVQIDRYSTLRMEQEQGIALTGTEGERWKRVAAATARDTQAIAGTQRIAIDCSPDSGECRSQPLPVICSLRFDDPCANGGWYGPESDSAFPTRYAQAAQRESYRLLALREAANQQSERAELRFAHLAAALTMLSVGVFLFGYSLTPQGRDRRALFSVVATGFALFGAGWALHHGLRTSEQPPDSAAVSFANAEVALHDSDYRLAIAHFRRATADWPEAVEAYADLAQAEFAQNEPDATGVFTVPKQSSLTAAIDDDSKAIENGSDSATVIADKAANTLFLGLLTHDDDRVREARELSAEAVDRFEEHVNEGRHPGALLVTARFSVAEADLALGAATAGAEYSRAIEQMVALRSEVNPCVIARASKTDLHLIAASHPELHARAEATQERVARAALTLDRGCRSWLNG
jgi:tetratricopeptide (TPR) repeat protein